MKCTEALWVQNMNSKEVSPIHLTCSLIQTAAVGRTTGRAQIEYSLKIMSPSSQTTRDVNKCKSSKEESGKEGKE